jgi:hypothetical protein
MKKITALIITALMLVSTIAFAAKPGTSPEANSPLRALWGTWGGQCEYFYILEVSRNSEVK